VTRKEDAKHVPDLPLVPIRSPEQPRGRGHRRDLVRIRLDPDPTVMRITQEVVDHLEPVRTGRDVHGRNVHDALVLAPVVVPQELEHGEDTGGGGVEGEFVLVDGELLDVFGETGGQVLTVGVEGRGEGSRVGGRVGREFLGKGRNGTLRDVGYEQAIKEVTVTISSMLVDDETCIPIDNLDSRMLTAALERIPRAITAVLTGRTATCLSTLVMEVLDAMVS
jgi:hypothetical protein